VISSGEFRMEDGWVRKESLAVTDGDGSQMLLGRMGTETISDGDGYNWCGDGWGWVNFPLPCRSLDRTRVQKCNYNKFSECTF